MRRNTHSGLPAAAPRKSPVLAVSQNERPAPRRNFEASTPGPHVCSSSTCAAAPTTSVSYQDSTEVKHTDFLVIGSGIAGLSYALKVAPYGTVAIVTKDTANEGCTQYAQGGVCAVLDGVDSVKSHVEDTMIAGAHLNDPKCVHAGAGGEECAQYWRARRRPQALCFTLHVPGCLSKPDGCPTLLSAAWPCQVPRWFRRTSGLRLPWATLPPILTIQRYPWILVLELANTAYIQGTDTVALH